MYKRQVDECRILAYGLCIRVLQQGQTIRESGAGAAAGIVDAANGVPAEAVDAVLLLSLIHIFKDGVVTLKGKVEYDEQKIKAEKLARKVSGVKRVDNQLVVVGKGNPR